MISPSRGENKKSLKPPTSKISQSQFLDSSASTFPPKKNVTSFGKLWIFIAKPSSGNDHIIPLFREVWNIIDSKGGISVFVPRAGYLFQLQDSSIHIAFILPSGKQT